MNEACRGLRAKHILRPQTATYGSRGGKVRGSERNGRGVERVQRWVPTWGGTGWE